MKNNWITNSLLIAGIIITFLVGLSVKHWNLEVINCIPDNQINYDYKIDLQQNFIIVYSKNGNIDTIPHGKLESFLELDNL